ncbi:MAG: hypothetical protein DRI97_17195, partial [Bacteroidetes bacterium]
IFADTGKNATGASVVIRGGTVGCVVDVDGSFMLNADGDPELVVSFVGYKSLVVKASEIGNKPLKLEVKAVELDLESVSMEATKESDGAITLKLKDGSDAQPVFLLDGEVVDNIENIDPETIESISVYKDPDNPLVKEYNAINGLVQIITKDGADLLSPKQSKKVMDESGANDEGEVFYIVEDMPKFTGGLPALKTYIYSNLEYPENVKNKGIEGEAIVRFLVNEKGEVVNGEVLRSSNQEFDAPALRVVKEMPDWTPGMQRGKAVKVWYVISIKFNDEKK